ncbi:uncharacterized protein LOC126076716 [Elephas maximus indicus]|uniref:uncharacterized protein LOC126076716 n=1 Tax=Elephas maximus indicus TaxID=99487 RepID=UPI002116CF73|nr:uncharacterized protein LOC126076716 [Elephas maximus indicus]
MWVSRDPEKERLERGRGSVPRGASDGGTAGTEGADVTAVAPASAWIASLPSLLPPHTAFQPSLFPSSLATRTHPQAEVQASCWLELLNRRRSIAPSQWQGNPLKKPRFIPPGRSNPSPNEEITKLNPDVKLFEVAPNKSQNDSRTCSFSLLHTKENTREINHRDNYSGKYCSEASAMPTLDPPHTVQTWMRKHRLVPVHYR